MGAHGSVQNSLGFMELTRAMSFFWSLGFGGLGFRVLRFRVLGFGASGEYDGVVVLRSIR